MGMVRPPTRTSVTRSPSIAAARVRSLAEMRGCFLVDAGFDTFSPQTYLSTRPQWGKLLQASRAGRGSQLSLYEEQIRHDDDAQHELHLLLLLLQGVGMRVSES